MLNIEVDTEAVQKRVETMTEQIKTFGSEDMPQGLTDWQEQDMRRKYPETEVEQVSPVEYNASTMIYPRSRTYDQTRKVMGFVKKRKPALSSMPRLIKTIARPILRPELLDKLWTRMVELLTEKIKWQ